jgi:hypothetical protein
MNAGDVSSLLYAAGMAVTPPTIGGEIGYQLTLSAVSQIDPDTGVACDVLDDYVRFTLGGVEVGPQLASNTVTSINDQTKTYATTLSAIGATLSDLTSGNIGAVFGWRSNPTLSTAWNSGNWSIVISPSSPATAAGGAGSLSFIQLSTTFNITVTWIGGGASPNYVDVNISSTCSAGGGAVTPPGPLGYVGTASTDNGIGVTDIGAVSNPAGAGDSPINRYAGSAKTVKFPLNNGQYTYNVTLNGSVQFSSCSSGSYPNVVQAVSASVVTPSPTTLKVDGVQLTACSIYN